MSWHCLQLLNKEDEDLDEMWRTAWASVYTEAVSEPGSAIFRRSGSAPALFFSPQAQELAEAFDAVECEQPEAAGLHQVAGDRQAWDLYFGRRAQQASSKHAALETTSGFEEPFEPTFPSQFDDSFRPTLPSEL